MSQMQEVAARLHAVGWTVSVAESCTAGGLAFEMTRIAGSSAFFIGGIIAYDNAVKTTLLDISEDHLTRFGAVSAETAERMATACRERFGTDLAVSITGIAGPGGGSEAKPVGLVYIALADRNSASSLEYRFEGDRSEVRRQAISAALDRILERLAAEEAPSPNAEKT